jgi:hypothetical protein
VLLIHSSRVGISLALCQEAPAPRADTQPARTRHTGRSEGPAARVLLAEGLRQARAMSTSLLPRASSSSAPPTSTDCSIRVGAVVSPAAAGLLLSDTMSHGGPAGDDVAPPTRPSISTAATPRRLQRSRRLRNPFARRPAVRPERARRARAGPQARLPIARIRQSRPALPLVVRCGTRSPARPAAARRGKAGAAARLRKPLGVGGEVERTGLVVERDWHRGRPFAACGRSSGSLVPNGTLRRSLRVHVGGELGRGAFGDDASGRGRAHLTARNR